MTQPLSGVRVVCAAIYVPAPLAARRLLALGAAVAKVEPPGGDPLAALSPGWHAELNADFDVVRLDLKTDAGRAALDARLADADVLLTATRPDALARLGLGWDALHARHPRLCHVAIVGHASPHASRPGHDLTYQAAEGLVAPPALPRTRPPRWRCCTRARGPARRGASRSRWPTPPRRSPRRSRTASPPPAASSAERSRRTASTPRAPAGSPSARWSRTSATRCAPRSTSTPPMLTSRPGCASASPRETPPSGRHGREGATSRSSQSVETARRTDETDQNGSVSSVLLAVERPD
ncbi:CoA transferase [Roseisolibacter sp. H3M3-2]|nr:CoA transferase [Roseisolibacter sp. H3M3-2]